MIIMMEKLGISVEETRSTHIPEPYVRFQFTSKRKRMSTIIHRCGSTEHSYDKRVHMKGAAEIVLDSCSHFLNERGDRVPLNDGVKQEFANIISVYAT